MNMMIAPYLEIEVGGIDAPMDDRVAIELSQAISLKKIAACIEFLVNEYREEQKEQ